MKLNDNDKFVKSIMIKAGVLIVFEIILLLIFFDDVLPLVSSLLLGGFISILFFRIMYVNILYIINRTKNEAKKFMAVNYVVRYLISGLVLFVCAKSDNLNIFTCFIGLLTIKLTLYILNLISLFSGKEEKKSF